MSTTTTDTPRPIQHVVKAGDLAYVAMNGGRLLVPVRVERVWGDDGDDHDPLRVTVCVTATREPFRRGERMHGLPASHVVARKATGMRNGQCTVIHATVTVPDDVRGSRHG